MENKLLVEINRLRQLMLLAEEILLQESFGSEIWQRLQRGPGFSWPGVYRLVDEIENSHNFFDDTVTRRLRAEVGTGKLFEVFFEEYNKLTDKVKKRAAVSFIADKIGVKPDYDDTITKIQDANTKMERNVAERTFINNFNDPEVKKFFQEDFTEVVSPKLKSVDVKGSIDDAMDNWDNILPKELNLAAKKLLANNVKIPVLRQDLYNFFQTMFNVYVPYIIELTKIFKLRKPDFSSINPNTIKKLTESIVGKLKALDSSGAIDNRYMDEINTYMKSIWNDANNLRMRFKRGVAEGAEYNANIMDWFSKRLEQYGLDYSERQMILKSFAEIDPTGKGANAVANLAKKEGWSNQLIDEVKTLQDEFMKKIPNLTKVQFQGIGNLITFGTPFTGRKELRQLLYQRGLPRTYSAKIFSTLLFCNFAVPIAVSGVWALYQSVAVTFDSDSPYHAMGWGERYRNIFFNEFMEQMGAIVSNPLNFIWPWKTYWDNLWDGMMGVLDALSKGVYKGADAIETLLGLANKFFLSVMGKTVEFLKSGKEKAKDMIKDAKNKNDNNSTKDSDNSKITPADSSDTGPPLRRDTIPAAIDTSGEEQ